MSMHALRGLEMVCLCRDRDFELQYAGKKTYTDPAGAVVADVLDMGCVACGANFYTRESSAIEFCPACGFMERRKFKNFQELQQWSNGQSWKFLKRNGHRAYGVLRNGDWRLVFSTDRSGLESSGYFDEVHDLLP